MSREGKESLPRKGPLSCVVNRPQKGGESRESRGGLLQSQVRDVVGSSGGVLDLDLCRKQSWRDFLTDYMCSVRERGIGHVPRSLLARGRF